VLAFIPICPSNRSGAEGVSGFVGGARYCFGCPPRGEGWAGRFGFVVLSPWAAAEQHSRAGRFRRGLSEAAGRVPQPPGSASSAGAADRGGFLWLPFFSRLKKVTSPPGCPRHPNKRCARRTLQSLTQVITVGLSRPVLNFNSDNSFAITISSASACCASSPCLAGSGSNASR